jgi:hypothetical protein
MNAIAIPSPDAPAPGPGGVAAWLLLSCAVWAGAAPAADELPRSPACRTALQALEQAEAAIVDASAASAVRLPDVDRQRAVAARLKPLRERVGQACLGGLTTSPPPSQHSWTAPAPAPRAELPPRPLPPVRPLEPLALPRVEPPVMVTQCNAATCLASDGSTLTRIGPTLVGPRGACTVQGAFVRCP